MLLDSRIPDLSDVQFKTDRSELDTPSRYDRDLQQRVSAFLSSQHRPALRQLNVEAREGVVTLRGNVSTFYEREISIRLARRVAGVVQLIDHILVGRRHVDQRQVVRWSA